MECSLWFILWGGAVKKTKKREYGFAELKIKTQKGLFKDVDKTTRCWMSHGDSIVKLPAGFKITASTENTEIAATISRPRSCYQNNWRSNKPAACNIKRNRCYFA